MAVFEYTALSAEGKKTKGVIDAESERAARSKLRSKNIYPTSLQESHSTTKKAFTRDVFAGLRNRNVPAAQLGLATRQLATLVGAGMPLVDSLRALGDQLDHPRLKTVFAEVRSQVNEGSTLATALRQYPKVFPKLYCNLVASGEASGTLELVLDRLAELLEGQADLRRTLSAALAYPALMLMLCVGVVILLLTYVVPQLTGIFEEQGVALPLSTQIVIGLSDFIKAYWWLVFILVVAALVLFQRYYASTAGRYKIDTILLSLPGFGPLITKVATQRFAQTLGTMLVGGVELLTALGIVRNVMGNVVLQEAIETAREGVKEGRGLAKELDRSKRFPRMLVHMVSIGEKTGELEQMLIRASDTYRKELNAVIAGLTAVLNPLLILFLAVVVGIILMAVMLPMVEMTSLVRR